MSRGHLARESRASGARGQDGGFSLLDLLVGISIVGLIGALAGGSISMWKKRAVLAAEASGQPGSEVAFAFPWALFAAIVTFMLVVGWLSAMSMANKAKTMADGTAWLDADEGNADDAEADAVGREPVHATAGESLDGTVSEDNPFALVTTEEGIPLTPAQAEAYAKRNRRTGRGGSRSSGSSRGGGFIDFVADVIDTLT